MLEEMTGEAGPKVVTAMPCRPAEIRDGSIWDSANPRGSGSGPVAGSN